MACCGVLPVRYAACQWSGQTEAFWGCPCESAVFPWHCRPLGSHTWSLWLEGEHVNQSLPGLPLVVIHHPHWKHPNSLHWHSLLYLSTVTQWGDKTRFTAMLKCWYKNTTSRAICKCITHMLTDMRSYRSKKTTAPKSYSLVWVVFVVMKMISTFYNIADRTTDVFGWNSQKSWHGTQCSSLEHVLVFKSLVK